MFLKISNIDIPKGISKRYNINNSKVLNCYTPNGSVKYNNPGTVYTCQSWPIPLNTSLKVRTIFIQKISIRQAHPINILIFPDISGLILVPGMPEFEKNVLTSIKSISYNILATLNDINRMVISRC